MDPLAQRDRDRVALGVVRAVHDVAVVSALLVVERAKHQAVVRSVVVVVVAVLAEPAPGLRVEAGSAFVVALS